MYRFLGLILATNLLISCADERFLKWDSDHIRQARQECLDRTNGAGAERYCNCEVNHLQVHSVFEDREDAIQNNDRVKEALAACRKRLDSADPNIAPPSSLRPRTRDRDGLLDLPKHRIPLERHRRPDLPKEPKPKNK